MPPKVVEACEAGDLVIFAGAGISTESDLVVPRPLYIEMQLELEMTPDPDRPFPEVMTAYQEAHGRAALLQRIKSHLDYVRSFPVIDKDAGRFHRELASLYTVDEIVTTNWDDYFERLCGAQPYISEDDLAFWKSRGRKVFKLHGSISSPGSVVATDGDYEDCYRELNEGVIGGHLKAMLATKTVVFVGYSLKDSDFVRLYELIRGRMGSLMPKAYVVTLDDADPPAVAADMHVIRTSGEHFVHVLKKAFDEDELLADERFDAIPMTRMRIKHANSEVLEGGEMNEDPAMYLCSCYQDGLVHAFDHQLANARKGDYFHTCHTRGLLDTYEKYKDERVEAGRWETVAYIEGYMNGLLFLILDDEDRENLPLFYVPGAEGDFKTIDEYREAAAGIEEHHPDAYAGAKTRAARLAPGIVFRHKPVL